MTSMYSEMTDWIGRHYSVVYQESPELKLQDSVMRKIGRAEAKDFIEEHEWLGYLGRSYYNYGLFWGDNLGCVVAFAPPLSRQASIGLCGEEHGDKVILLSRGACASWTPPFSASFFISRAVDEIAKTTPFRIIQAYADPRAKEIGTIYQALNWYYLGMTKPQVWYVPVDFDPERYSTRVLPKELKSKQRLEEAGIPYKMYVYPTKHKYATIVGDKRERKLLTAACEWEQKPYPKREA